MSGTALRWAAAVVVLVVAMVVGVEYGRAEGRAAVRGQQRQLLELKADVGRGYLHPSYTTHDLITRFTCLVYVAGGNPIGLELCFDPARRLVEAVDRRSTPERIASLRWDPAAAPLSISAQSLSAILHRLPPSNGLLP